MSKSNYVKRDKRRSRKERKSAGGSGNVFLTGGLNKLHESSHDTSVDSLARGKTRIKPPLHPLHLVRVERVDILRTPKPTSIATKIKEDTLYEKSKSWNVIQDAQCKDHISCSSRVYRINGTYYVSDCSNRSKKNENESSEAQGTNIRQSTPDRKGEDTKHRLFTGLRPIFPNKSEVSFAADRGASFQSDGQYNDSRESSKANASFKPLLKHPDSRGFFMTRISSNILNINEKPGKSSPSFFKDFAVAPRSARQQSSSLAVVKMPADSECGHAIRGNSNPLSFQFGTIDSENENGQQTSLHHKFNPEGKTKVLNEFFLKTFWKELSLNSKKTTSRSRSKAKERVHVPYNPYDDEDFMKYESMVTESIQHKRNRKVELCCQQRPPNSLIADGSLVIKNIVEGQKIQLHTEDPQKAYVSYPRQLLHFVRSIAGNSVCCDCGKNESSGELEWVSPSTGTLHCEQCALGHIIRRGREVSQPFI